jgi:hypothetical protein
VASDERQARRFARMRLRTTDAFQLVVHHVDLSIRRASHDR